MTACGIEDFDGLRRQLGPRWAYRLRGAIATSGDEDFAILLASLAEALRLKQEDVRTGIYFQTATVNAQAR